MFWSLEQRLDKHFAIAPIFELVLQDELQRPNGWHVGDFAGVVEVIRVCRNEVEVEKLWVLGWSFGTDLALKYARDPRIQGLILLSPPLRTSEPSDLEFWAADGRQIIAMIPEFDDYLQPEAAAKAFKVISQIKLINVDEAKHLWVGEPAVYRVLSEITRAISPEKLPLPIEI